MIFLQSVHIPKKEPNFSIPMAFADLIHFAWDDCKKLAEDDSDEVKKDSIDKKMSD